MFPTLSFMIGAYLVTRMAELIFRPDRHVVVKIFAAATIIVVAICIKDLMTASTPMLALPRWR